MPCGRATRQQPPRELAARLPADTAPSLVTAVAAQLIGGFQLARVMESSGDAKSVLKSIRDDLTRRFDVESLASDKD
jgi:hypothetical protein